MTNWYNAFERLVATSEVAAIAGGIAVRGSATITALIGFGYAPTGHPPEAHARVSLAS